MQIGRVIGTVVSTQKHRKLDGAKLLLVQPLALDGQPRGVAVLTIDSVGAGIGERVLIVIEGKAAGRRTAPEGGAGRCRDHWHHRRGNTQ
jgi:ethanolamine utilization protein EutN